MVRRARAGTRRARRHGVWRGIMGAALLIGVVTGIASRAEAVHDLQFQLDGDVSASTTTTIGGVTQAVDWDSFFKADGSTKAVLPTGFGPAKLTADFTTKAGKKGAVVFDTSDSTTYATGSKDTLNIGSGGWQCSAANNLLSKDDIMNTYAAAYKDPATGDPILYFGLERNSNNGDANVAFWFLQASASCDSSSGTANWTGHHTDGDILIVSAFTAGGRVSGINAYRWNGDDTGSLGTTPVAIGGDCRPSADGTVPGAGSGDTICATANDTRDGSSGTIPIPWPTANATDGVGHSLRTSEFFEGGINLKKANLAGKCFNEFVGDTRSSQSLTATIFDYAQGTLGECHSTTVTTPTPAHGSSVIPASGVVTTSDSALLTVTGVDSFNGNVSFFLCGPLAVTSTATCDSGGIASGSPVATTNGTYTSTSHVVTEVGRYCWRAEFSGDTNTGVPPSSDSSDSECFTLTPRQPTLSTQAGSSPVDFGNPVTDTATLGNTANRPGTGGVGTDGSIDPATPGGPAQGTIQFTLYKDNCSSLATSTTVGDVNPQSRNVSGDGTYPTALQSAVSFTPGAPGTYHWVATYGGDGPNTLASTAAQSPCPDASEQVIVRQIPTSITTKQFMYPNDTATITSSVLGNNLGAGGSVVFKLFQATAGSTALANCTANGSTAAAGFLYTETKTLAGGNHSEFVTTANTSVSVNTTGSYYWRVTYTPLATDTAHLGTSSVCVENTVATFNNDPPGS